MEKLSEKAINYFMLAKIAEQLGMNSEAAANYFKALSAINDQILGSIGLKAKDHSERFLMLKQNFPSFYELTDRLFSVYRRTYTGEIKKEEVALLRKNVEEAFKNAKISLPSDGEIKERIKKIS